MNLIFWQYFWEIETALLLFFFILFTFFIELRSSAVSSLCLMVFFSSLLFLNLLDFNLLTILDSSILINSNIYFIIFNFIFLFISIYFWQIFFSRSNSKMEFGTLFFFIFVLGLFIFKIRDFLEAFLIIETLSFIAYILAGFEKDTKIASSVGIQYLIVGSVSSIFLILSLLLVYYQFSTISLLNLSILDLDSLSTNFYKIRDIILVTNMDKKDPLNIKEFVDLTIFGMQNSIENGCNNHGGLLKELVGPTTFITSNEFLQKILDLPVKQIDEGFYLDLFSQPKLVPEKDALSELINSILIENLKSDSFFTSFENLEDLAITSFTIVAVVGENKEVKLIEDTENKFGFNPKILAKEFFDELPAEKPEENPVEKFIGEPVEIVDPSKISIIDLEDEFFDDFIREEMIKKAEKEAHEFSNLMVDWLSNYTFTFVDSFIFGILAVSLSFLMGTLLYKIKGAPFHVWAPTIYTRMPTASMILLITTFTLIFSLYFFQLFFSIFSTYEILFSQIFLVSGLLSLIFGFLGAFDQKILKKFFVFSSIGHVAFLLFTFISQSSFKNGTLLLVYLLIYLLSTILLWYLLTFNNPKIDFLSNLLKKIKTNSFFYFIFVIIVFSMSGIPPLAGFYVKFDILSFLMNSNEFFILFLSLLITVASFYYYLRLLKISTFENFESTLFSFLNIDKFWQFIRLSFLFLFLPLILCFPLIFEQSFFYLFSYSTLY